MATKEEQIELGYYEIFIEGETYKFAFRTSKGVLIAESEPFNELENAENAISNINHSLLNGGRVLLSTDKRDRSQFTLKAANGRILLTSIMYDNEEDGAEALNYFKSSSLNAPIEISEDDLDDTFEVIKPESKEVKKGGILCIVKAADGKFHFQLLAPNGNVICSSASTYTTPQGAKKGIDTFKDSITNGVFHLHNDDFIKFQFKLYSSAKRLNMYGEKYSSKQNALNAANQVLMYITNAKVLEM